MSAGSEQRSEHWFVIRTPCRHNICTTCIKKQRDVEGRYQCPICNDEPEVVDGFPGSAGAAGAAGDGVPVKQAPQPQEVPPDVCTGSLRTRWIFWLLVFISIALAFMVQKDTDLLARAELTRVQWYAVEVTLDPDTAHPNLLLSDDGKQVRFSESWKNLSGNPDRFYPCVSVLGQQSFSSGRFYFQVQVKGRTDWDLGVARESVTRKGDVVLSPQNGFWTIWLRDGKDFKALADAPVHLSLQFLPEKVGLFVDYEEGLVSFYDADTAALIFSFTGSSFAERLLPYFSPAQLSPDNSAPLIITSVRWLQRI